MNYEHDVLVIGDGVTGRLLARMLEDKSLNVRVLGLHKPVGESVWSQGIIHCGMKYHRLATTDPQRWEAIRHRCQEGTAAWDEIVAVQRLDNAIMSDTMTYRVDNPSHWITTELQTEFEIGQEDEFALNELVFDTALLLDALKPVQLCRVSDFRVREHMCKVMEVNGITARHYVFCTGGYEHLLLGKVQRNPIRTLRLEGVNAPLDFIHFFTEENTGEGPELTVTACAGGDWNIGGDVMTNLVDLNDCNSAYEVRNVMDDVFDNHIPWKQIEWKFGQISRASLLGDHRVAAQQFIAFTNYYHVIPGKLTYAPVIAKQLVQPIMDKLNER